MGCSSSKDKDLVSVGEPVFFVQVIRLSRAVKASLTDRADAYVTVAPSKDVKAKGSRTAVAWSLLSAPVWNELVPVYQHPKDKSLTFTVTDKDVVTDDDVIGRGTWTGDPSSVLDTDERQQVTIVLDKKFVQEGEENPDLSFKVFSPKMAATIQKLQAYKESYCLMQGPLDALVSVHPIWESFFAIIFPFEGNRPAMLWVARDGVQKCSEHVRFPKDDPTWAAFPRAYGEKTTFMPPFAAIDLMIEWAGCLAAGRRAVTVGERSLDGPALAADLKAFRDRCAPVADAAEDWAKGKQDKRFGIVGGMGPVAGAIFSADLAKRKGRADLGVEVLMLSDVRVEAHKDEKFEAYKAAASAAMILDFLGGDGLVHTCCASNTFHLVVKPQPDIFLSIFDACAKEIKKIAEGEKVALMCTDLSLQWAEKLGYGSTFQEKGIDWIGPDDEWQRKTMDAIKLVKSPVNGAASLQAAREQFLDVVAYHVGRGATVMALCCTEIPVVLSAESVAADDRFAGKNIKVVDSSKVLADHVVDTLLSEKN